MRADDKHPVYLNVIPDMLTRLECPQSTKHLAMPDLSVVFRYHETHARAGLLAK